MRAAIDWVTLRENRAARGAIEQVADCVSGCNPRRAINPLFLHGPAGTGKSQLIAWLIAEVSRRAPQRQISHLLAGELEEWLGRENPGEDWKASRQADLLILEDLQHLPARVASLAEPLIGLLDHALARHHQVIVTAHDGPARLSRLPSRLTSRLSQGLVVGLELLAPGSRLLFLQQRARARQLNAGAEVLTWLADQTPGSPRQLEGALTRLETLLRMQGGRVSVAQLAELLPEEATRKPSLERIIQQVGHYFAVEPRQLCSRRRSRDALLPRQVSMYLARQLTNLSLDQIGAFFGGRDHTTVLHACRKVEEALAHDANLSGAVRQLHADLA